MTINNAHRDQLILENLNLVDTIAGYVYRSIPVHVDLDDLKHAGMMGLIDAAEKFEAGKDVAFGAYAKHRIRGAILDSMRRSDSVSRDLRKQYKQVEATRQSLTAQLHREPTEAEIAEAMGISADRWRTMMIDFRQVAAVSLQNRGEREGDRPMMDVPAPADETPENVLARTEMKAKLAGVMSSLPARYCQVLQGYYERDLTMREIAEELGVRESRISQIHKSALALMNQMLSAAGVREYAALAA